MEEAAGMPTRRSPRVRPQIQPSEEVNRRRSPRPRPQIHASEEGAGMTRRRRRTGSSPEAAASLPEDDDMLREILLRLPPQPSSLPRASAVCKRWRGLVADPRFLRQFYAHHRKPPLLGVFELNSSLGIVFTPILNPPDRIPRQRLRFTLGLCSGNWAYKLLDCRHGLVLVNHLSWTEVVVCDPIASEQHRVAVPPELRNGILGGAVLCAAGDQGHVHGGCHSSAFKVVLLSESPKLYDQPLACVYTSETGIWGDVISTEATFEVYRKPPVLVGNCLYWLSMDDDDILAFDLGEDSLTVIGGPPVTEDVILQNCQIIQAEHGALGYATLSNLHFQMWQRNISGHGASTWVLWKTIETNTIIRLPSPHVEMCEVQLLGYDEDDVVFLRHRGSVYMVQLKSMQSRKLDETRSGEYQYFPFKSFFTPGASIAGGFNGAEMVQL